MMNSKAGFSAVAALAISTFLGFAPGALAQSGFSGAVARGRALGQTSLGQTLLSQTSLSRLPASLMVLALGPVAKSPIREHPMPQPPGCNNGRGQRGGNCNAVPEGGTTMVYLSLVGLCCCAAAVFSMRRARMSAAK